MLAVDIETLGLLHHIPLPPITCVCFFDGDKDLKEMLLFHNVPEDEHSANAAKVIQLLDDAPVLAGFNAVYFDLEYIQRHFGATHAQLQSWIGKCVDPFMCMKHIVGKTCKLNALLERNGLESKTGSGANAIVLAKEGKTQELLDYCLMDAILTWRLCKLPNIRFTDNMNGHLVDGVWRLEPVVWKIPTLNEAMAPIDLDAVYANCEFVAE